MKNTLNVYRKNTAIITLQVCDYQFTSGDTIYFTVKVKPDNDSTDDSALIKTNWIVGTDVEVENGQLQLELTPTQTDIAFGQYFYDIKLISAANDAEQTLITGDINILDVATLRA